MMPFLLLLRTFSRKLNWLLLPALCLLSLGSQAQCPTITIYGNGRICDPAPGAYIYLWNNPSSFSGWQYTTNGGGNWLSLNSRTIYTPSTGAVRVRYINTTIITCTSSSNTINVTYNTTTNPSFSNALPFTSTTGTGGGAWGMAVSPRGQVAVASNDNLAIYNRLGGSGFSLPLTGISNVSFTPDGKRMLVVQTGLHRVLVYNSVPSAANAQPDLVIGARDMGTVDSGSGLHQLKTPYAAVVTPDGRLYISDHDNNRILGYNQIPEVNGAAADFQLGSTAGVADSLFQGVCGLALTADGRLAVSEMINRRVVAFAGYPRPGHKLTSVYGQSSLFANPTTATLNTPVFISAAHNGRFAVPDYATNRVPVFGQLPVTGNTPQAWIGQTTGTFNIPGSGSSTLPTGLSMPRAAAFMGDGRLLVNENGNERWSTYGLASCQQVDLALSLAAQQASMTCSHANTYTVTLANPSSEAVSDVVVRAALPFGTLDQVATASTGTYDSSAGIWKIPVLAANASVTLALQGNFAPLNSRGSVTVMAGIWGGSYRESNEVNNGASLTTPIAPLPEAQADSVATCAGANLTLTAREGSTYAWAHGGSSRTTVVSPATPATYTATVVLASGCTTTHSFYVAVNQPFQPVTSLNQGDSACSATTLSVSNSAGCVGCTFKWNNGPTTSVTQVLVGTNNYSLSVTTPQGCQTIITRTITGLPPGTWRGNTTSWITSSNWCGGLPNSSTAVIIPRRGAVPAVASTTIGSLHIDSGATINLNNNALRIVGNQTGKGIVTGSASSSLRFANSTEVTAGPATVGTLQATGPLSLNGDITLQGTSNIFSAVNTNSYCLTYAPTTTITESSSSYRLGRVRVRGASVGTGSASLLGVGISSGINNLDTVYVERITEAVTVGSKHGIKTRWIIKAGNQPVDGRNVTFRWLASNQNGISTTGAQLWSRPDGGGSWTTVGSAQDLVAAGGFYSITARATHFSEWTVSDIDNPLPVSLISFTGRRQGQAALLKWATASETHNLGFVIERSADNARFDSAGFVAGQGTSRQLNHYGWQQPFDGPAYYRLVQVDRDGSRTPSHALFLAGSGQPKLVAMPNPTTGWMTLTGLEQEDVLVITNSLGQAVHQQTIADGQAIDISHLPPGIYKAAVGTQVLRLVKQ